MNFQEIISQKCEGSVERFWKAMNIWLNNSHLVNRRISSCMNILTASVERETIEIINSIARVNCFSEIIKDNSKDEDLLNILNLQDSCSLLRGNENPLANGAQGTYLFVNKHLPRESTKFSAGIEFTVVDKLSKSLVCCHISIDRGKQCLGLKRAYKISYGIDDRLGISVERSKDEIKDPSVLWLSERLFPRLLKWIENDRSKDDTFVDGSLNLVSSDKYTHLYNKLKRKYGLEMVKKWPECTDPNKFVYEDVAIATYLILLWENERGEDEEKKKQSFVDLGCGNGLLVYILTSEGYCGTGIDLRKRQIWNIYPATTNLVVKTIVPSSANLFPEADWLIGNHSDELTPWIPVIASRSSYKCRFFLLPCCAHEFDGRKFQRDSAAKSQYHEYIKYIKKVSEDCGFKTDIDKLRIPSTKRICLIGRERTYSRLDSVSQDKLIDAIINARSSKSHDGKPEVNESDSNAWSRDFKPRESVERVRNCTQVDRTIIDEIISVVAAELLRKVRVIRLNEESSKTWNAGGNIELAEIAKIIAPETLKKLRNECGGIQTLLKNNGHIFRVINGTVQFKIPGSPTTTHNRKKKSKKNFTLKMKPCWFYENHPDGCPVSDELCCFKHQ